MRIFILLTLLFTLSFISEAQIIDPVKWEFKTDKLSESTYELKAVASIDEPWHLYGQYFEDGGPIKLSINFQESLDFKLIGITKEYPKPKTYRDNIFNIEVSYFAKQAEFTQKIEILRPTTIKMIIEGQVCNDETGMCIMVFGEHTYDFN